MKKLNLSRFLVLVICSAFSSLGHSTSVWDQIPKVTGSTPIVGHVRMIAVDDERDRVYVRIQSKEDQSKTKNFEVCARRSYRSYRSVNRSETLDSLRAAFNQGHVVEVELGSGPFDNCISRVSML